MYVCAKERKAYSRGPQKGTAIFKNMPDRKVVSGI